jgi:zinc transport system permease protein
MLARSFRATMWWSVAVGVAAVVVGLVASRVFALVPGGTIVLVAAATFAVVALVRRGPLPGLAVRESRP